jgi:hypothetical protein
MPPLFPFDVEAAGAAGGASPRGVVMQAVKSNTESRIKRAHIDDLPLAGVLYRLRLMSNHYSVKVARRVCRHSSPWRASLWLVQFMHSGKLAGRLA